MPEYVTFSGRMQGTDQIFRLYADACVVSSVHRPHLLARFDEVVFMAQGHIVDVGTALELEERQPAFRVSLEKAAAAQEEVEVHTA